MWLTSVLRFLRRLQKPPTIHPAMPWSFRRDFHIDLSASYGSYLLESNLRPVALQTPPDLVAGDKLPVRIYLWERDATTGDPVAVVTPEGTSMVFAGRPANAPLDSSLLFLSSNLAESETEPGVWEGTLDLNTVELHNHLASQTTGEITILGEIELRSSDATPNRQSIQFDLNARRQVYAGVEGEAAALLAYPIGNTRPAMGWMLVSGAGMESLNGMYLPTSLDGNGDQIYHRIENLATPPDATYPIVASNLTELCRINSRWVFRAYVNGAILYEVTTDEESPDLGVWVTYGTTTGPAPTVESYTSASPPYFRTGLVGSGPSQSYYLFVHSFDAGTNSRVWLKTPLESIS